MSWVSLGALAMPFQLQRHGHQLRGEMARLGQELTTGTVANPARHLRGDTAALSAISAAIDRLAAYEGNTRQAAVAAEAVQTGLSRVDALRGSVAERMLLVAAVGVPPSNRVAAGEAAAAFLADAVAALSVRVAGAEVLSGAASDRSPLVPAAAMLDALDGVVSGFDSADAVAAAVHSAFTAPGGLFETAFLRAGPERAGGVIAADGQAPVLPTAADSAIRETLAALATAAMVGRSGQALNDAEQRLLTQRGAERLLGAADGMAILQGRVGQGQERLDDRLVQIEAQRNALGMARQDLAGADPYAAATRLQAVQTQIETIYTITARTARLNLMEYLR